MIQADPVRDRRVQIVRVSRVFCSHDAVFVGSAVDHAPVHPATGHPGSETEIVVFPASVIPAP